MERRLSCAGKRDVVQLTGLLGITGKPGPNLFDYFLNGQVVFDLDGSLLGRAKLTVDAVKTTCFIRS
jgi:hypothetical protein